MADVAPTTPLGVSSTHPDTAPLADALALLEHALALEPAVWGAPDLDALLAVSDRQSMCFEIAQGYLAGAEEDADLAVDLLDLVQCEDSVEMHHRLVDFEAAYGPGSGRGLSAARAVRIAAALHAAWWDTPDPDPEDDLGPVAACWG